MHTAPEVSLTDALFDSWSGGYSSYDYDSSSEGGGGNGAGGDDYTNADYYYYQSAPSGLAPSGLAGALRDSISTHSLA
jgi:hypothetical protein